jgi:hypothetical protein
MGMADSIEIVLAEGSDDIQWRFRVGKSPEEAYRAGVGAGIVGAGGTVSAGVNYYQRVRLSGQYGFLVLYRSNGKWAVESIKLRVLPVPAEARKF